MQTAPLARRIAECRARTVNHVDALDRLDTRLNGTPDLGLRWNHRPGERVAVATARVGLHTYRGLGGTAREALTNLAKVLGDHEPAALLTRTLRLALMEAPA